jgi:hypothetical protein
MLSAKRSLDITYGGRGALGRSERAEPEWTLPAIRSARPFGPQLKMTSVFVCARIVSARCIGSAEVDSHTRVLTVASGLTGALA